MNICEGTFLEKSSLALLQKTSYKEEKIGVRRKKHRFFYFCKRKSEFHFTRLWRGVFGRVWGTFLLKKVPAQRAVRLDNEDMNICEGTFLEKSSLALLQKTSYKEEKIGVRRKKHRFFYFCKRKSERHFTRLWRGIFGRVWGTFLLKKVPAQRIDRLDNKDIMISGNPFFGKRCSPHPSLKTSYRKKGKESFGETDVVLFLC